MLAAMVERVFLGWDRPFLTRAVAWLLERREQLPGMWVVVPTAQSGRRLREAMAVEAGAVLAPKVVTPGAFLKSATEGAAPDWVEQLAWLEILEGITDWSAYTALIPEPPDGTTDWAAGLAREMVSLRHALQDNGLLLGTAARKLRETVEAERWEALAHLEGLVERKIHSWGMASRSRLLAEDFAIPDGIPRIVLAGVTEMPPLVSRTLTAWRGPVTALIHAPEHEAAGFSPIGLPLQDWAQRPLAWPTGTMRVVADPRQQAIEALRLAAEAGTRSDELALGSADTEVGDELARTFTREGWITFHPAAAVVTGGLARWFEVWGTWLRDPTLACLADLLALPETGILVSGKRAQKAKSLAELRDRWMVIRTEDLQRRMAATPFRSPYDQAVAEELLQAAISLESWRAEFLGGGFLAAIMRLLEILSRSGQATADTAATMAEWISGSVPMMARVKRGAGFWIDLMLADLPSPAPVPPEGRVLDVQGWLELSLEPGSHLILCGMNEGKVPARGDGGPWLGESVRGKLGLIPDAERAARDAFLYQSLLESRRDDGRVDVICGKSGAGGDSLLPSRLLLAAERDELPERVKLLFKEVEPPEAGLRWHADWQWQPWQAVQPVRLNVTSLGKYLECPFRYYLNYALKMQKPETGRSEWNARDFGNVAHEVLERWGRDTTAREYDSVEPLHRWLSAELDRVVAEWFAKSVPLALRIQTESLRQRLLWLARVQATTKADGWDVVDVERKVELPVGEALIVAKIDRIDRHRETGRLRVLDYKTGKVESVDKAHRKKLTSASTLPAHLDRECPAVYLGEDKGKSVEFLWHNLQLPLYASALVKRGEALPTPCYFTLNSTSAEVAIHEWNDFETADLEAAEACADWVAGQIAARVFWPPSEQVKYDDFALLAAGRSLLEMVTQPQGLSL